LAVYSATRSTAAVAALWLVHRCCLGLATPWVVSHLESRPRRPVLRLLFAAQAACFVALGATASHRLDITIGLIALDGLLAPASRVMLRATLVSVAPDRSHIAPLNAAVNVIFTVSTPSWPRCWAECSSPPPARRGRCSRTLRRWSSPAP
jgi:hypothetical protein